MKDALLKENRTMKPLQEFARQTGVLLPDKFQQRVSQVRNAVVHEGRPPTREEAEDALNAVAELIGPLPL
ncbi:MAG: hypothetical protein KC621_04405 [Myxococcales bacterium]|nr:hypothetical protein [Myxococcales bacterium]